MLMALALVFQASEVAGIQLAAQPSPTLKPLTVVESQLDALKRGDVQTCFVSIIARQINLCAHRLPVIDASRL